MTLLLGADGNPGCRVVSTTDSAGAALPMNGGRPWLLGEFPLLGTYRRSFIHGHLGLGTELEFVL